MFAFSGGLSKIEINTLALLSHELRFNHSYAIWITDQLGQKIDSNHRSKSKSKYRGLTSKLEYFVRVPYKSIYPIRKLIVIYCY